MVSGAWVPLADVGDLFARSYTRDKDGKFSRTGATGQAALDAAPATLTPAPRGHFGDYEGEQLDGPPGMGSVRALSEYEGVEYVEVNSHLRSGPMADSPAMAGRVDERVRAQDEENAARIAEIDKTMDVSRLTEDVQVERVIQHGASVFGSAYRNADMNSDDFDRQDAGYERWQGGERPDLTGLKFRDKGYTSTTADPVVAEKFGERWARFAKENPGRVDGEPVIMKIQVPKGTGAVQLSPMWSGKRDDPGAAELLLERGLTYEVTADHGVGDDGFRRLDVAVVPGE